MIRSRLASLARHIMLRTRKLRDTARSMERMEVVTLLKVPVKILCYGEVTPSQIIKNPESKPNKLVLIIPGNPGVGEFYSEFGARIHEKTKLPVWIVGHGGHGDLPVPRSSQYPDLYNLQGQIRQKRELIDSYLSGVKLRCIGHSIGCKMLLEILKSDEKYSKQIEKVELLFPTIEKMAKSPAGGNIVFALEYLYWPVIWMAAIFSMFPNFFKAILLRIVLYYLDYPPQSIPAFVKLIEPRLVRKALNLADDEMKTVIKRDDETIEKYSKILHFYYGATDKWTPLSYYEDLKNDFPDIDAEVDKNEIPHTFSIKHGQHMADNVINWWKNN